MAIYRLLQNVAMEPEDIARLHQAYETTLRMLDLKDRSDPITNLIARKLIEIRQTGVKDPTQLSERALSELGIRGPN